LYYYLLALFIIVVDQLTKWLIVSTLELNERVPVIGEFFQITSHRNTGAAFGILTGQRWFFIVITIVIVAGLVWYIRKTIASGLRLAPLAFSLVLGGAIGNFIDRLLTGEVVDFFKFRFQFDWFGSPVDYTFPIFNVADMMIVIGVTLAMIHVWQDKQESAPQDAKEQGVSGNE
jgi:signal peptidase II